MHASPSPSVGSSIPRNPPPFPTTAYCIDCDAYHYVGPEDFSTHEISGCGNPHGGLATIYPTIFECQKALDTLNLHVAPYDADYVDGLYSDYTCCDDDSPRLRESSESPAAPTLGTLLSPAEATSSTPTLTSSLSLEFTSVMMTSTPSLAERSGTHHSRLHASTA
jgi:hypothetical protein